MLTDNISARGFLFFDMFAFFFQFFYTLGLECGPRCSLTASQHMASLCLFDFFVFFEFFDFFDSIGLGSGLG